MQKVVDEARAKGAQVVVVLSHNGMDVDLKMASRVRGIDAIFGGHTHDGVPVAVPVQQRRRHHARDQRRQQRQVPGRAWTSRSKAAGWPNFRYRLLPVFANVLPADAADGTR
jgi:sulfur-oxidizing protein SoxB